MKKLRRGAINTLLRQLDQALISKHHFDATFNGPEGMIVSLIFRDKPEFFFRILHPKTEENSSSEWHTVESPGQYFTSEERYRHHDFQGAAGRIAPWISRIVEELSASNAEDEDWLSSLRRNLDAAADALPEPDAPFSNEEIVDWSERFEELLERLKELEEDKELQRGQVERLRRELEELKRRGTEMPKRTWLKAAGHKILDVFEHGAKAAIEAAATGAVKALLKQDKA